MLFEDRHVSGCSDWKLCWLQLWAVLSGTEDCFAIVVEMYCANQAYCCQMLQSSGVLTVICWWQNWSFGVAALTWLWINQTYTGTKQNSYMNILILLFLASWHSLTLGQNTDSTRSLEGHLWTGNTVSVTGKGEQAFFLLTWKEWPITFAFKYELTHSLYFRYLPYGIPGKSSRCSSAVFCFGTQILFVFFLSCLQWAVILLILSVSGYCLDFLNVNLEIRRGERNVPWVVDLMFVCV